MFNGPTTNSVRLASAIKNTEFFVSSNLQIQLYDISGNCQRCRISCSPYLNESGIPIGCKVQLQASDAITLDVAVGYSIHPAIIIGSESPYSQLHSNSRYLNEIGLNPDHILACVLERQICPIISTLGSLAHTAAVSATTTHGLAHLQSTNGNMMLVDATCVPVLTPDSDTVGSVMLVLAPRGGAPKGRTSSPSIPNASPKDRPAKPAGSPRRGAAALTLAALRGLGDVSLRRAAELLGMSPTALKAACRRLGLARWPRDGWAAHDAAAASSAAAAADSARWDSDGRGGGRRVDMTYVRRLNRKYRGGGGGGDGGGSVGRPVPDLGPAASKQRDAAGGGGGARAGGPGSDWADGVWALRVGDAPNPSESLPTTPTSAAGPGEGPADPAESGSGPAGDGGPPWAWADGAPRGFTWAWGDADAAEGGGWGIAAGAGDPEWGWGGPGECGLPVC